MLLLGFGYRTVALAGLRTLEKLSALGMVHCIQQVLNECYFFVLMVGSRDGKTGLLATERTCGHTVVAILNHTCTADTPGSR